MGDRRWCHPSSLMLQVPQPFQHLTAGGTFRLAHGMETLVWAVSKRVTLVTSAWDMLEVGKKIIWDMCTAPGMAAG